MVQNKFFKDSVRLRIGIWEMQFSENVYFVSIGFTEIPGSNKKKIKKLYCIVSIFL
jgi:hypothetical protein